MARGKPIEYAPPRGPRLSRKPADSDDEETDSTAGPSVRRTSRPRVARKLDHDSCRQTAVALQSRGPGVGVYGTDPSVPVKPRSSRLGLTQGSKTIPSQPPNERYDIRDYDDIMGAPEPDYFEGAGLPTFQVNQINLDADLLRVSETLIQCCLCRTVRSVL